MKWISSMGMMLVLGSVLMSGDDKERVYQFKKDDVGKLPAGWTVAKTGSGEGSAWKIVEDVTSPSKTGFVLAQTAESPNAVFNICVVNDSNYKDLDVSVAFKSVQGKLDQGGGLVWRYKDANNYYVVRMNPLEENFRVYKVQEGKRSQFASAEASLPAGEWHTIKVTHKSDHIECYLDDKKYFDVKDTTFPDSGKIGVWTKADAQSYFDDLKVRQK